MAIEYLLAQLEQYGKKFPGEQKVISRFEDLLSYVQCFDRSLLWGHFTASCWVVNPTRDAVLLLHHKKLNRWLQPGGHADGEQDLLAVAKKELQEETGIVDVELLGDLFFDLDIHTIPERKEVPTHEHFDVRFAFIANSPQQLVKNEESNAVKWVNIKDIVPYLDGESSMIRMLKKMKALV